MLNWGERTYVMGIINVTPDSFSGDGVEPNAAIEQGLRFVEEGADVLDVGGESTRPGAEPIDAREELRRVLPVIQELAKRVRVPISVDTSRASVARVALQAGAKMVNDVWALSRDAEMASVLARAEPQPYVVLMHNRAAEPIRGELGGHYAPVDYGADLIATVVSELAERVRAAEGAGIARSRLIVDPGIGFGKGREQNLELLRRLKEFTDYQPLRDLPLLVGTSRKSVVGLTLNLPPEERLEGTLATLALAIDRGADMVRVHDVRAAVRCCRMADAIVRR